MRKAMLAFLVGLSLFTSCSETKEEFFYLPFELKNIYKYDLGDTLVFVSNSADTAVFNIVSKNTNINRQEYKEQFNKKAISHKESMDIYLQNTTHTEEGLFLNLFSYIEGSVKYKLNITSHFGDYGSLVLSKNASVFDPSIPFVPLAITVGGKSYTTAFKMSMTPSDSIIKKVANLYLIDGVGIVGYDTYNGSEYRLVQ